MDIVKAHLQKAIEDKTARVVVLGLGYVGLPVACLFAEAGFPVTGIRRSQDKVDMINRGLCPIEGKEPGLAELLAKVASEGHFQATTDYAACREAQVVLIAVETPVETATRKPGYAALREALTDLGHHLSPGTLVIIESTIAPRTMERIVKPLLEETSGLRVNADFYLVNCPERVMPGKLLQNIRECHRVVGGMNPEAAELAVKFYRHVVQADLDPVDCITAEIVKTAENAYRDVQIAFANEMALICEDMDADVWQVRELVNKAPYRAMHLPGAGVGGHCIPKDSWLLIAWGSQRLDARLMPTARGVNDAMPLHMAELTRQGLTQAGVALKGARVAVLGYAYLENSDDTRNTPTEPFVEELKQAGAEVSIHDPYVHEYNVPFDEAVRNADCVVVMVRHDQYREIDLAALKDKLRHAVLVDGRHVFDKAQARAAGFSYLGVGNRV
jgi:UDP-N-acetyl-D-mannosaminuronic acid dehydrogenase